MANVDKKTVYIDVDDEITAIIDKVKQSPEKIVALVLPKRATVLQSIVNMKLLKKSATSMHKSVVLITSEAGLLPIAGAVGLHVAKTLQSKPEIPPLPNHNDEAEPDIVDMGAEESDVDVDKTKTLEVLSTANDKSNLKSDDELETIELDNTIEDKKPANKAKSNLAKKFKVPDFDKFRLRFFLAILGVIILGVGWFMAYVVMPKATITIKTDSTSVSTTFDMTASTSVKELDKENKILPAVLKEVKKTDTEKTTATGKKDKGTKASGTLTIKNCEDTSSRTVPAGTVFSASGKSYVTTSSVTVRAGSFSGGGSVCNTASDTVNLTAQSAGESYNISASTYTTSYSGLSGNFRLNGSSMTGGTTNVVTVVSQSDIDAAVAKMKGRLDSEAQTELTKALAEDDLYALEPTKITSEPVVVATPALDQEASGEVTITAETTYSVLGVSKEDLSTLIKDVAKTKIDTEKQSITNDGLDSAALRLVDRKDSNEAKITLQTIAVAGAELNESSIKESARGMKRGDVEKEVGSLTGVKEVDVSFSPFWIYKVPKATKKITVIIDKPETKTVSDKTEGTSE